MIVIVCVIYGILIEFLQETLTVYRISDYKDVLANTIGIILAIIVYNKISKKIDVNSNQDLYKNE
jgi:VanZ family protein